MSILWTDSNDAHARPLLTAHCLPQLFATTVCHNCLFTYCLFTYCCSPIVVHLLLFLYCCAPGKYRGRWLTHQHGRHTCAHPSFPRRLRCRTSILYNCAVRKHPGPGCITVRSGVGLGRLYNCTCIHGRLYSHPSTSFDVFRLLSVSFDFFRLLSTSFDFFRCLLTSFVFFRFLSTSFDFFRCLSTSFDFRRQWWCAHKPSHSSGGQCTEIYVGALPFRIGIEHGPGGQSSGCWVRCWWWLGVVVGGGWWLVVVVDDNCC
jgi:hypothetical protein